VAPFSIPQERIDRRAKFFFEIGEQVKNSKPLSAVGPTFDFQSAECLAEAYFLLSEAFKPVRIQEGHKTTKPKIAALTCAAVAMVNPFHFDNPDFENLVIRYANPILAMHLACGIIDHPFHKRSFDERRRIYSQILGMGFTCLDEFIADRKAGTPKDLAEYKIALNRGEMREIENLVNLFTVYEQMPIFKKK
jgi:hypothetical protein